MTRRLRVMDRVEVIALITVSALVGLFIQSAVYAGIGMAVWKEVRGDKSKAVEAFTDAAPKSTEARERFSATGGDTTSEEYADGFGAGALLGKEGAYLGVHNDEDAFEYCADMAEKAYGLTAAGANGFSGCLDGWDSVR